MDPAEPSSDHELVVRAVRHWQTRHQTQSVTAFTRWLYRVTARHDARRHSTRVRRWLTGDPTYYPLPEGVRRKLRKSLGLPPEHP